MTPITLSPTLARRLAVTRQRLAGPRPEASPAGILELVRDLGCLQLDPIRTVERSHYLVLWSRLGDYDPADLARFLGAREIRYGDRLPAGWQPALRQVT